MLTLPQGLRALAAVDLVQGLALPEVRDRLHKFLRLRDTGQRGLAFYLTEIADRRLYQASGYSSAVHYAEDRLDLARRRTGELIAVGRKLLELPAIDRAFCEQRIGWTKVRLLLKVTVPEHEAAWLQRAFERTCRDLAHDVQSTRPGSPPPALGERKGLPEVRMRFGCSLSALMYEKLELAKQKLGAELGQPVTDVELLDTMTELFLEFVKTGEVAGRTRARSSLYRIVLRSEEDARGRLILDGAAGPSAIDAQDAHKCAQSACVRCDAEAVAADPGEGGAEAPSIDVKTPAGLRERVISRDAARCRCCGSRWRLMVHHIRFRSRGGPTKTWNLITLCSRCHALVHEGLLVLVGESAEDVRFRNKQGEFLNEPGAKVDHARLQPLARPRGRTGAVKPRPEPVPLEDLPAVADGEWWRRHSHLIRFRAGRGLEFRSGVPLAAHLEETAPAEVHSLDLKCRTFGTLVGQDALVHRLRKTARASRTRGCSFPHTLFVGPPGTGKTTLARGVAETLGARLISSPGPLLDDTHALLRLLASLREGDMLFLDEIHQVPRAVLETLYEAMAEGYVDLTLHAGAKARCVRLALPAFSVLAATTEEGALPHALRSRFGLRECLGLYAVDDLAALATAAAARSGVTLLPEAAYMLAEHARGTPREALRLVERVLDEVAEEVAEEGRTELHKTHVAGALAGLGYDRRGLDPSEQRYFSLLRESPGPIPLTRLARMLGQSRQTLVDHVEPHLFRRGLIQVTPRGRMAV